MIYYSTKYVGRIVRFEGEVSQTYPDHIRSQMHGTFFWSKLGRDVFETLEEAAKEALNKAQKDVAAKERALEKARKNLDRFFAEGVPVEDL